MRSPAQSASPRPRGAIRPAPRVAGPAAVRRRLAVLVAVLATVLGVAAPNATAATSCPDIDAHPSAIGIARATASVACLVNHERTAAGLGSLNIDAQVRRAAQDYAVLMAVRGFFAHISPDGTDPGSRLLAAGFNWLAYGENIASGQSSPREVMADWLKSPGHCRNLMTPTFTVAGYGVALAGNSPYWVQNFGRPMSAGSGSSSPAPACPRQPAPFGATPAPAPVATIATTTAARTVPKATARRSDRRLRISIKMPSTGGRKTVVVRVRQGSRTVRTSRMRRSAGTTKRMTIRLPKSRGGRVYVRAGTGRTVRVSFR